MTEIKAWIAGDFVNTEKWRVDDWAARNNLTVTPLYASIPDINELTESLNKLVLSTIDRLKSANRELTQACNESAIKCVRAEDNLDTAYVHLSIMEEENVNLKDELRGFRLLRDKLSSDLHAVVELVKKFDDQDFVQAKFELLNPSAWEHWSSYNNQYMDLHYQSSFISFKRAMLEVKNLFAQVIEL